MRFPTVTRLVAAAAMLGIGSAAALAGAESDGARLEAVLQQNRQLQEQLQRQQKTIDEINLRMAEVLRASERHERELRGLDAASTAAPAARSARDNVVRVAAEAGIGLFDTGAKGQFPNAELRVDDPVVSIEAAVQRNVYVFTELRLLTRETTAEAFQLGELYVDFEDVSAAWGRPGELSLRAGRLNVPFGEEYLQRTPVTNPLISHSLSDIWGVDEGVEAYGKVGPIGYVVAVQNGGVSRLRDFTQDKAIVGRLSWDPSRWLHVSGSAMRTGTLGAKTDYVSEVWFGGAVFRSIGAPQRTTLFSANLFQGDATLRWRGGHAAGSLGRAVYHDDEQGRGNRRSFDYGHVETVQSLAGPLFAALRYSFIRVPKGYPVAGWGHLDAYFFSPVQTTRLERTSVGFGYRFGAPLVLKFEYAWESGRTTAGESRTGENFFGTELGVRF